MKSLVIGVLLFVAVHSVCCMNTSTASSVVANTTEIKLSAREIEKTIEGFISSITKRILPYVVRNSDIRLSSQCMSTFVKLFVDVRKLKITPLKLLDAIAKPPFGMLQGTFSLMGAYDECLSISVNKKGDVARSVEEEFYHGQYCTIEAQIPEPMVKDLKDYGQGKLNLTDFGKFGQFVEELPLTTFAENYNKFFVGVCLPSTCSIDDLKELVKQVPIPYIPIRVKRCEDNQAKPLSLDQIIILSLLGFIAAVVLICTCLEGLVYLLRPSQAERKVKNAFVKFVQAFSMYNNTKMMLSEQKDSVGEISCVNGMYVLGTCLVIIYHTYLLPFFVYFSRDVTNLGHYLNDPKFTLVSTMGVSIDAYFLFSGMLLVYGRFKRGGAHAQVNIIKMLIRRYLRLCPSLMLIVALIIVLPLIGSGPVWEDIFGLAAENSRKWWWTYLFMYNNFLAVKDQNFLYLWFIPCLMQLTIVGTLLAWFLSKSKKFGITLIIIVSLASNLALGIITFLWKYPPSYAIYFIHNREHFEIPIYTSPLSHVSSFCIGILLGYYMSQKSFLKWSKEHVTLGWIASFALTVGTQYILYIYHDGKDVDTVHAALYGATHKTLFCLGMSWIILACSYGYGGVIGKIFSWKGFGPLSKLGYFAYLAHYLVIAFHVSMARTQMEFTHYEVWIRIFSYIVMTFMVAYVLYITFELPLNYLESLVLPARPRYSEQQLEKDYKNGDIIKFNGNSGMKEECNDKDNYQSNLCIVATKMIQIADNSRL